MHLLEATEHFNEVSFFLYRGLRWGFPNLNFDLKSSMESEISLQNFLWCRLLFIFATFFMYIAVLYLKTSKLWEIVDHLANLSQQSSTYLEKISITNQLSRRLWESCEFWWWDFSNLVITILILLLFHEPVDLPVKHYTRNEIPISKTVLVSPLRIFCVNLKL